MVPYIKTHRVTVLGIGGFFGSRVLSRKGFLLGAKTRNWGFFWELLFWGFKVLGPGNRGFSRLGSENYGGSKVLVGDS